ncbi:MAG: hypothetical protein V3V15_00925 [Sphingorhabdus sp.]
MSLDRLTARGQAIGERAAMKKRDEIIGRLNLPDDVSVEARPDGFVISGKRLRARYVTDPNFRNRIR